MQNNSFSTSHIGSVSTRRLGVVRASLVVSLCLATIGVRGIAPVMAQNNSQSSSSQASASSQCSAYSGVVYAFSDVINPDSAFMVQLEETVRLNEFDSKMIVSAYLPRIVSAVRDLQEQDPAFSDRELASNIYGAASLVDYNKMSATARRQFDKLSQIAFSDDAVWQDLRRESVKLYDLLVQDSTFRAQLELARLFTFQSPVTAEQIFELARGKQGVLAVMAEGAIARALERQSLRGQPLSITTEGWVALNQNRIFQELMYLGYPCGDARSLVSRINPVVLSARDMRETYGERSVRYASSGGAVEFDYHNRYVHRPKREFISPLRGWAKSIVRANPQPKGEFQVTDFALGKFDRVVMSVDDPARSFRVLQMASLFRDRQFTVLYNPRIAELLGIADLPAQMRSVWTSNGIDARNVEFKEREYSDEDVAEFFIGARYPWTRDGWLAARDGSGSRIHLVSGSPSGGIANSDPLLGATEVTIPLNTEGGAHFPVGKFIFLTQTALRDGEFITPDAPLDMGRLHDAYTRIIGRTPIVIDTPSKSLAHLDVYTIYLPFLNGRPVIGVADLRLGTSMLAGKDRGGLLRDKLLSRVYGLKMSLAEQPTIQSIVPASSGLPRYLSLDSYSVARGTFDVLPPDTFTQDVLDETTKNLRRQGFVVFRFPYYPGFNMSNGIMEVSAETGATFYAADAPPFNQFMATVLNAFGYSLKVMPQGFGISDGAGYHCLTNEDRT